MFTIMLSLALSVPSADEGKLFIYVDNPKLDKKQTEQLERLKKHPTTVSVAVCRFNVKEMHNKKFKVELSKTVSIDVTGAAIERHTEAIGHETLTWGKPRDGVLAIVNGHVSGLIYTENGVYSVTSIGGGLVAVEKVDQAKFPKD